MYTCSCPEIQFNLHLSRLYLDLLHLLRLHLYNLFSLAIYLKLREKIHNSGPIYICLQRTLCMKTNPFILEEFRRKKRHMINEIFI